MRRVLFALCLLVIGLPSGASSADPEYAAEATVFATVTGTIPAGATYQFFCEAPPEDAYAAFTWFSADLPNGGYHRLWGIYRDTDEGSTYVRAKVAGADHRIGLLSGEPSTEDYRFCDCVYTNDSPMNATFRGAWAVWGAQSACGLRVNGSSSGEVQSLDGAKAYRATPEDFSSRAHISTGAHGGWMISPRHDHEFDGFLVYFSPSTAVFGPDGEQREDGAGMEVTSGTWSFRSTWANAWDRSGMVYALALPRSMA